MSGDSSCTAPLPEVSGHSHALCPASAAPCAAPTALACKAILFWLRPNPAALMAAGHVVHHKQACPSSETTLEQPLSSASHPCTAWSASGPEIQACTGGGWGGGGAKAGRQRGAERTVSSAWNNMYTGCHAGRMGATPHPQLGQTKHQHLAHAHASSTAATTRHGLTSASTAPIDERGGRPGPAVSRGSGSTAASLPAPTHCCACCCWSS
jgi:hypothetical protein